MRKHNFLPPLLQTGAKDFGSDAALHILHGGRNYPATTVT
jgi:hypothetical protein